MRRTPRPPQKRVTEMTATEARAFFLDPKRYCSIELPEYFSFRKALQAASQWLRGCTLTPGEIGQAKKCEGVNHLLLSNKDGRHAWRPLQLIHPVLYVSLVNAIYDNWAVIMARFAKFAKTPCITCCSIPLQSRSIRSDNAAQILNWWREAEQRSVQLALDYNYAFHADITDCYGAIYTHSIAWALHGKPAAKKERTNKLVGNLIDHHLQAMHYGQTNGIPQGSTLMDFIAEMVLGYADHLLNKHPATSQSARYQILRHRDDYRILTDDPQLGEQVLKSLTEVLAELGLKLNPSKTRAAQMVIASAMKSEKWAMLLSRQPDPKPEQQLLLLYEHGKEHPNSGQLLRPLEELRRTLKSLPKNSDPLTLISIAAEIAYNSPRAFPQCAAVISDLLPKLQNKQARIDAVNKVHRKMSQLPNNGCMEIWLQRIAHKIEPNICYREDLCRLAQGGSAAIWESGWLQDQTLRATLSSAAVVDRKKLSRLSGVVKPTEISVFPEY